MTYSQALEFLFSQLPAYHRIGKAAYRNDLKNTISLDNYFGNPHLRYPTVHVAGTNGKGSVSHMIASVLQEAGFKTGLYTSPHLKDFRERIRVDGEMIPESKVVTFVAEHSGIIGSVKPSFFEMTVAMAFNYFAEQNVDIAIIEVGLGGRLDSTNIINPVLSVITNIGHDHMDLLGNSFEKIAIEKAGIIKQGIPVVISETQPETENVFIETAERYGSRILFADKIFSCDLNISENVNIERKYQVTDLLTFSHAAGYIPLGGNYQSRNIQAVFTAFRILNDDFRVSEKNILDGIRNVIKNTGLQGRWQILADRPLTICDTGHNKEGIRFVVDQLKVIPRSALHIILGFVNDKDLGSVLPLFPNDAVYYFTKASVPRALNEISLRNEAEKYGLTGECFESVADALKCAKEKAQPSDLIFIGGSTFVVAEVL
jgi:dihydrofolate synthase / folylpolyglutamate synthase